MAQQKTTNDHAKERAAIEQTLEYFLDAWNTHDAHAFAITFTQDADVTNFLACMFTVAQIWKRLWRRCLQGCSRGATKWAKFVAFVF